MKVPVYGLKGEVKGEVTLGKAFTHPVRTDIIRRALLAEESVKRQPYGSDPIAGLRTSAEYIGTRSERNSMMNKEMSRMKRIFSTGYMRFRARAIPGSVKGRKAHPPKAEKVWLKKVNKKERLFAILSAISATADKKLVMARGHMIEEVKHIPLVVEDGFQELKRTSDVEATLMALGFGKELERCGETKTRAGRGKSRGRRVIRRKGPLIVIDSDKGIGKAARNIPGVDVMPMDRLTVGMLAPGAAPGRVTVWTKSAADTISKLTEGA